MNSRTSNLLAGLVGIGLALALPLAASAEETNPSKAPVHHMSPPAVGGTIDTGAPAVITEGGEAMLKRDGDAVKAPVHHQDPGAQ